MPTKTRISITINPSTNEMLEKISTKTGVNKSALVEKAVTQYLKKQLESDLKALSKMNFDDLPTEDQWLEIETNPYE